ncbi:MAG: GTPase, partial [Lachnospiraceae bacterium]|nr:GTPase [Lachnospiraceae bacterium]
MNTVPMYLITGFLDSGKTTFLRDTLQDSEFLDGEKTVLILCEEGEEEYDMDILAQKNVTVLTVEEEEDLNPRFLMDVKKTHKPEKVMIEFNGTWSVSKFMENGFPGGWEVAQMITTVDATTFESYMSN